MIPYNRKVWGYDPARLDTGWMAQRVAPVNLAEVLRAVEQHQDHVSWGPNATFRFPRRGGTGAIWQALAARLPADRLRYRTPVTAIDTARKLVQCADGTRHTYDCRKPSTTCSAARPRSPATTRSLSTASTPLPAVLIMAPSQAVRLGGTAETGVRRRRAEMRPLRW